MSKILKFTSLLREFGINPMLFIRAVRGFRYFMIDLFEFRKNFKGDLRFWPCLHDRFLEGGEAKSEYFWQDLTVSRWIFENAPDTHVDIGSSVESFVAHVASFREIEVFDVRPVNAEIPGIRFHKADIMDEKSLPKSEGKGYCDSLSCLHVLEHCGLGRYGDPVNPFGWSLALKNIASLLKIGGIFYLSTPIGKQRVECNANWVFDPRNILTVASEAGLMLARLSIFDKESGIVDVESDESMLEELGAESYTLAIFTFTKKTSAN